MTMVRDDYDAKRPMTGAKKIDPIIRNNDGEMTMMRNDYDAKRPTTGAK